ncbi:serine hydrolase domain-containing protein [Glaciimonas sp. GG7]
MPRSNAPLHFEVHPTAITSAVRWNDGVVISFDEFQQETHTNALLILHQGKLVYENYSNGAARDTVFPSYSLAKSVVSALVGVALNEGAIKSLDDPVSHYIPALASVSSYSSITVDQLLNMRSGIDVSERYDSPFSKIAYLYVTTDLHWFMSYLGRIPIIAGNHYTYRSVDSQLLSQVLVSATGSTLSAYLDAKIWQPMGAEYAATWSIDGAENNVEKGFCCLNATAIDFLKFGALYLNHGSLNGKMMLPFAWTDRQQRVTGIDHDFDYSNGWWLPKVRSPHDDYMAIGIHGQFIYINPTTQTVIVKLSDHGAVQDEVATIAAFRTVASELSKKDM